MFLGSLWYEMYRFKKWSYQNLSELILLQSENRTRETILYYFKYQDVTNLWENRNLTLEEILVLYKTLAISKIVFLTLLTKIPHQVARELEKIQKSLLWNNSSPNIKYETLCKDYSNSGSKNIYISCKIVILRCFWIRRLYGV